MKADKPHIYIGELTGLWCMRHPRGHMHRHVPSAPTKFETTDYIGTYVGITMPAAKFVAALNTYDGRLTRLARQGNPAWE